MEEGAAAGAFLRPRRRPTYSRAQPGRVGGRRTPSRGEGVTPLGGRGVSTSTSCPGVQVRVPIRTRTPGHPTWTRPGRDLDRDLDTRHPSHRGCLVDDDLDVAAPVVGDLPNPPDPK